MRILITGGAGYVGSAALRHIKAAGHEVLAYDNLSEGHAASVDGAPLVVGDIADTGLLTQTMQEFEAEAVMHFAASTNVGESTVDPDLYYRNNVEGTRSVLNAMRGAGVRRLLFSSTCSTYGFAGAGKPMDENTPQIPMNPYACSKMAVEWMIRDFADAYGFGFTLLRYFNASGACPSGRFGEAHNPETHLIPLIFQVALGQRDGIKIFGTDYDTPDGTCIRDYVHVDDLASAHLLAIEATEAETRAAYNIGTGRGYSVKEVIAACEAACGHPIAAQEAPRRAGDPDVLVAAPAKIKAELGWAPKYQSLSEIVETAWAWHQAHSNGYTGAE